MAFILFATHFGFIPDSLRPVGGRAGDGGSLRILPLIPSTYQSDRKRCSHRHSIPRPGNQHGLFSRAEFPYILFQFLRRLCLQDNAFSLAEVQEFIAIQSRQFACRKPFLTTAEKYRTSRNYLEISSQPSCNGDSTDKVIK
jgi:hypothetical protein